MKLRILTRDNPPQSPTQAIVSLAAAHARLAKWALTVYVGAAVVVVTLLVAALVTEKAHDQEQEQAALLEAARVKSLSLQHFLELLSSELERLSSHSEIESSDNDDSPERRLLELAHKRSTLFNVGVAILDRHGVVVRSEPSSFLSAGSSFASEDWFTSVQAGSSGRYVHDSPSGHSKVLYVVAPVIRSHTQIASVVGAIDLSFRLKNTERDADPRIAAMIVGTDGALVAPALAPALARAPVYRELFATPDRGTSVHRLRDESGERWVVAKAPLPSSDLVYLLSSPEKTLFAKARQRMYWRLALGLGLVIPPLVMLVLLLQRALRVFRQTERQTVEHERLQILAEASNLIAHEVRNALNGLGVGLDLLLQGSPPDGDDRKARIARQLRDEMHRLSDFTGELMLFSKGIVPHPVRVDLADCVPKLSELSLELAAEAGCQLDVKVATSPLYARVDTSLLRVVLGNLIGNAIDVLSAHSEADAGHVRVELSAADDQVRLRISDDGPGVPTTFRDQLFEPFRTTKPSGTGLGLALSRRIARAHGGDLVLEESPKGACFLLTLPAEAT